MYILLKVIFKSVAVMFVWLINHQLAIFLSQNKSATSNQPTVLFFQNKSAPTTSNEPSEQPGSLSIYIKRAKHINCTPPTN
jgi:hypothetical protein